MDASVIVCTYNRAASLRDTLRALKAQQPVAGREWGAIVKDWFSMLPISIYKLLTWMFENSRDKSSQNVESLK
jgi:hypothetical protein